MSKITLFLLFLSLFGKISAQNISYKKYEYVGTGASQYYQYLPMLTGKRVGVVTNHTGIIQKIIHNEDNTTTIENEHLVDFYGKNKKPTSEQLKGIEVMLFDLQDVGVRFYTYISTLHYVMEACAENYIPLVILDRPNPNGYYIDGAVLEPPYKSFIGMHPVPVVYGMTIAEYAQMINGEKWLKNGIQCNLKIVPLKNYDRNVIYPLPIPPSPNLPNETAVNLYPSLCFFEGTNISMGRGTQWQFQIYGSPYLKKTAFTFTPKPNSGDKNPKYNGKTCYGEDLSRTPPLTSLNLSWLLKAYQQTEGVKTNFFNASFDKLAGNKELKEQLVQHKTEKEIKTSWKDALEIFKKTRKKYLLYPSDF